MLASIPQLEVRSRVPPHSTDQPPVLFVHGGYCDAWCWEPFFLPRFAARGHAAYALSLRGHGQSQGRDLLWATGLDDYVADVERVAASLPSPPVLIGHSMGAAIVERLVATRPVRAAALLAPLPPAGLLPVATRLAAEHPDYMFQMSRLDPTRLSAEVLHALQPFYFSERIDRKLVREASKHLNGESPRALMDLSLRLHWALPERDSPPMFVLGVHGDRICRADDVVATAQHHGVTATMLPGLAHMLMLEPEWERAADAILGWIATLPGT
ncbi:MAG TPA: alpha/beta fold hydrolase [Casimicrobiaceae bacterium]|nr:alpha/beta fold hydrolase [Casimicrobiaceae bacterium]